MRNHQVIKKVFFSLFFFFLFSSVIGAQPHQQVRGRVVDANTHEPIEFATLGVVIEGRTYSGVSDAQGRFQISGVPVGRALLLASCMGYEPYRAANIEIRSAKESVLEIGMVMKVSQLKEVVVRSQVDKEANLNSMILAGGRMVSPEEANRYAGSFGDVSRMVSNYAGVISANDSRNDIVVRGNTPSGIQWRVDGFEIASPNHFSSFGATGGPIGMLNNNQLSNSDFLTGGFPAEYGNLLSGIMDLKLRNGNSRKYEFLTGIGMNGLELGAEGYFSKKSDASFMINFRKSFLKLFYDMGMDFGTNGAVPDYWDLSGKINVPLRKGNLSLVVITGKSNIDLDPHLEDTVKYMPGDWDTRILMKSNLLFTGLNYTARLTSTSRLENRLSYQRSHTSMNGDMFSYKNEQARPDIFESRTTEERYSWQSTYYHRLNAQHFINAGVGADLYRDVLFEDNRMDSHHPLFQQAEGHSVMLRGFVQDQIRFSEQITFVPGIYTQYYAANHEWSVEPRLSARWRLNSRFAFTSGIGLVSQLQNRMIYLYKDSQAEESNADLRSTKNAGTSIGGEWLFAPNWRFKVEGYYQYLYDIPVFVNTPQNAVINVGDDYYNPWNEPFVNKGKGRNYGLELTLERFFADNYYLLLTGSLYESKYTALDGVERNTKFNGNFGLNLLGGYEWELGKQHSLSINTKLSWMGGKRLLPSTLRISSDGSLTNETDWENAYTHRGNDYFRWDINLAMKSHYRHLSVEWFVEMNNITDRKNILSQYQSVNQSGVSVDRTIYQMGRSFMGGCRLYF